MIELTCQECGAIFEVKPYRLLVAKFCSHKCFCVNRKKKPRRRLLIETLCIQCKERFGVPRYRLGIAKFCSRKCKGIASRGKWTWNYNQIELKCVQCKKPFYVTKARKEIAKYCSRKCSGLGRRVKERSKGHLTRSCLQCGKSLKAWLSRIEDGREKFCNKECHVAYQNSEKNPLRKERVKTNCLNCNSEFEALESDLKRGKSQYCGIGCQKKGEGKKLKKRFKEDNDFIARYFKGRLFGKDAELSELDKKILKTRVLLFNLKRKENQNVSREKTI